LYGEDGYRHNVQHKDKQLSQQRKRNRVTIREFICFRLQTRSGEAKTLLSSQRLFQEFIVDGCNMMESKRLCYIKTHQKQLRVEKYSTLNSFHGQNQSQPSNIGKRVILPSTFDGSRRYMDQLYFDGMAMCSYVGFPNLFFTFTCNPQWPEIQRVLRPMNLNTQVRLDELLTNFKLNEIFGKVLVCKLIFPHY